MANRLSFFRRDYGNDMPFMAQVGPEVSWIVSFSLRGMDACVRGELTSSERIKGMSDGNECISAGQQYEQSSSLLVR
jgi:hypothetical protein